MASSEQVDVGSRAAELRRLVAHHNHRYHVLDLLQLVEQGVERAVRDLRVVEDVVAVEVVIELLAELGGPFRSTRRLRCHRFDAIAGDEAVD